MSRILVFVFLVMSIGIYLAGCGTSNQAKGVAELMTAMLNKIDTSQQFSNPSPSPLTIPNQISCNDDIFTIETGGLLNLSGGGIFASPSPLPPAGYTQVGVSMTTQLNAYGPNLSADNGSNGSTASAGSGAGTTTDTSTTTSTSTAAAAPTYALSCSFSMAMFNNIASNRLAGVPILLNCANYECIVNSRKVECGDVQNELNKLNNAGGCQ